MSLRHRHGRGSDSAILDDLRDRQDSALTHTLKKLDMYPKVAQRTPRRTINSIKTPSGATLSIISSLLIVYLILGEFSLFFNPPVLEHIGVDTQSSQNLIPIHFNITFPAIPCPDVRVDAQDVTGEQQVNVIKAVHKQRLTLDGGFIGTSYLDRPEQDEFRIVPGIGLMRLKTTETRVRLSNEGCNLAGNLLVKKVSGNFHFALGKGLVVGHRHVHHFNLSELHHFNTSHMIHELTFGPSIGIDYAEPLNGQVEILRKENSKGNNEDGSVSSYTGHFEYFLQIVPTSFTNRFGTPRYTYQYSTTEQYTRVNADQKRNVKLPGVFFIYKISPFMVRVEEQSPSVLHLITNLCAVVGGVITVTGIIDSLAFHIGNLSRTRKEKSQAFPQTL